MLPPGLQQMQPVQAIQGLSHKRQKSLPRAKTVSTTGCTPGEEWPQHCSMETWGLAGEVFSCHVSQVSHVSQDHIISTHTLRFLKSLSSFQEPSPPESYIRLLDGVKLKIILVLPKNAYKRMMTNVDVTKQFLEEEITQISRGVFIAYLRSDYLTFLISS